MENPNQKYTIQTEQYDISFDEYTNFEKKFGYFSADGREYTVTERNTPRQWLNFMVNDSFASAAANDGSGFTAFKGFYMRVTKYYSPTDYLVRKLNGKRRIVLKRKDTGACIDLLESRDMKFIVKPGSVRYEGTNGSVEFRITLFVPDKDSCECWIIELNNKENGGSYELSVSEDIALLNMVLKTNDAYPDGAAKIINGGGWIMAVSENNRQFQTVCAGFGMKDGAAEFSKYTEESGDGKDFVYTRVILKKDIILPENEPVNEFVVSAAAGERSECKRLLDKYSCGDACISELDRINIKWDKIIHDNCCELPNKNLMNFLNVWMKNQVYLTMRYNRFDIMGFRDLIQDTWGHLLVSCNDCRKRLITAVSQMYKEGKFPKKFDPASDIVDAHDFMDGPVWIPIAVDGYIKETGDFGILDEMVTYKDGAGRETVKEHILKSLDYLYHSRGRNGLILMRRGDWFDGLEGINEYGEATTVWGTMAAFHAQNIMSALLPRIGDGKTAQMLDERSAEYKKIVNDAAWDGNWFVYAFIDDVPIGASRLKEGKIFLNPQTWSIISGIVDDKKRIRKMQHAINIYLSSIYGTLVMAPPYTKYGEKCGRIQKQRPGTFGNGSAYVHAAAFRVLAECELGNYDEALDLFMRILPNHPDNPDSRRTSEPYSVPNVYYGPMHPCAGLNLYTWFTAAPSWLLHIGFENILGVCADYDGLKIEAHDIDGWDKYSVKRTFRNTVYNINFVRSGKNAILLDGEPVTGNVINSAKPEAEVTVMFN